MRRLPLAIAAALACAAPLPAPGWRIIGPGGGGSLFHATVSPHDSRTALVACDMTGSYLTHDGGATWRIINLGEPAQFFVFDPTDARVIYAKALGVFRSADGGETWIRFFPGGVQKITMGDDHASGRLHTAGEPSGEATAMAVDPADSRSLYLALGWQKADSGRHHADLRNRVAGYRRGEVSDAEPSQPRMRMRSVPRTREPSCPESSRDPLDSDFGRPPARAVWS